MRAPRRDRAAGWEGLLQRFVEVVFLLLPLVVRDMMLTAGIRVESRIRRLLMTGKVRALPLVHEPITPAALSPHGAFGVLAVVAAVLDSMEAGGGSGHRWVQQGVPPAVNAAPFVTWLNDNERSWLQAMSNHWDRVPSAVFSAASIEVPDLGTGGVPNQFFSSRQTT